MDKRPLVEGHMANFGISDIFEFLRFGWFFSVFQKNWVFGYSWSTRKPRFPMDLRPLFKGRIANFGIFLDIFEFLCWMIFSVFQKNRVLGYSWSTPLWHRCYYPHRSRDAFSPVCGIFFWTFHPIYIFFFFFGVATAVRCVCLWCCKRVSEAATSKTKQLELYTHVGGNKGFRVKRWLLSPLTGHQHDLPGHPPFLPGNRLSGQFKTKLTKNLHQNKQDFFPFLFRC